MISFLFPQYLDRNNRACKSRVEQVRVLVNKQHFSLFAFRTQIAHLLCQYIFAYCITDSANRANKNLNISKNIQALQKILPQNISYVYLHDIPEYFCYRPNDYLDYQDFVFSPNWFLLGQRLKSWNLKSRVND